MSTSLAVTRPTFLTSPLLRQYGGIVLSIIVLGLVFSFLSPRFLAFNNFMNILQQVAVVAVAAYGMTYVILLGEIDLSVWGDHGLGGHGSGAMLCLRYRFCPDGSAHLVQRSAAGRT